MYAIHRRCRAPYSLLHFVSPGYSMHCTWSQQQSSDIPKWTVITSVHYIFTFPLCRISEPYAKTRRNVLISWTHEMLVVVESLALRLLVAVSTTVNCSRLQDQMASVSNTRMGSCAIFSSLKESKNSIMSAAVPMYTSNSWDSWSLVRSPGRQSHFTDFSYMSRSFLLQYVIV